MTKKPDIYRGTVQRTLHTLRNAPGNLHGIGSEMTEIRCKKCNRLLLKAENQAGAIEIKCGKCGLINCFSFWPFGKVKEDEKIPYLEVVNS